MRRQRSDRDTSHRTVCGLIARRRTGQVYAIVLMAFAVMAASFSMGCRTGALVGPGREAEQPGAGITGGAAESVRVEKVAIMKPAEASPAWSWAAAVQTIVNAQGYDISQSQVVRRIGRPGDSTDEMIRLTRALTETYVTAQGPLKLSANFSEDLPDTSRMIRSIENGKPFIVCVGGRVYVAVAVHWIERESEGKQLQDLEKIECYSPGPQSEPLNLRPTSPEMQNLVGVMFLEAGK